MNRTNHCRCFQQCFLLSYSLHDKCRFGSSHPSWRTAVPVPTGFFWGFSCAKMNCPDRRKLTLVCWQPHNLRCFLWAKSNIRANLKNHWEAIQICIHNFCYLMPRPDRWNSFLAVTVTSGSSALWLLVSIFHGWTFLVALLANRPETLQTATQSTLKTLVTLIISR